MQADSDVVERYLATSGMDAEVFSELLDWIKAKLAAGQGDQIEHLFPRLVIAGLDYTTATSLHRAWKRIRSLRAPSDRATKIAVLGSSTTHQLVDLIDLYLQAGRINAEFYEAEYGTLYQEFFDSDSGLRRFRPDFVVIVVSWRDLKERPDLGEDAESVRRRVRDEVSRWSALWRISHEELGAQVIQSNFAAPPWRVMGNLDSRHPAGFARFIAQVNTALAEAAPASVTLHDVDQLSSAAGRWEWGDDRFYHQAKLPCSPEYLADYAHSLGSLMLSQLGAGKKCLVLDLDNTLWGGVIGDDGLGGIRLGQGEPEGEAFLAFQHYVKALGKRGVILAVCSKNTDAVAREVFEKHTEMVLRMEDISCFMANWDDKATNLVRIAEQLNIGLNSLVFFDDNPAERSIVRRLRPEVAVPEVPDDPACYIRALDRQRYFEALTISPEDFKRTEFYRADSQRQALGSSAKDLDSFLQSLEMVARIRPVDAATLERTVQLIGRSNQFNLTTRRHTSTDIRNFMENAGWLTRVVSLSDRFGDNGLISVVLAKTEGDALIIDTWLMSCRVLKRGVERMLLNCLVEQTLARGLKRIVGEYIPTAKNGLVSDHYQSLGFVQIDGGSGGATRWQLLVDGWHPQQHFIRES